MNFLSLFSGCGGLDLGLEKAGFKCLGQVEKMKYALKVLKKHWPKVPKWEDIRNVNANDLPDADLISAGFPCQDLSIAGNRKGLKGEKSVLFWECYRIIKAKKPQWVLLENVPGLLSSNGGNDFRIILDKLAEIGYIIEADICDSQYFGVAQRRKRVFIICQHINGLLKKRTIISASIIAKLITEILLILLVEAREVSSIVLSDLDYPKWLSSDGLKKRLNLFGIINESDWIGLLKNFIEMLPLSQKKLNNLGLVSAYPLKGKFMEDIMPSEENLNILELWKSIWVENWKRERKCITLIATNLTIEKKIYSCAKILNIILQSIGLCKNWQKNCLNEISSILTSQRGFINYARQVSGSLFTPMEWVRRWQSYEEQAEQTMQSIGYFGDICPPEILFEQKGSSGNDKKKQAVGERGLCISTRDGERQDPTVETLIAFNIGTTDFTGATGARSRNVVAQTLGATPRGNTSFVWQDTYIAETNPNGKRKASRTTHKLDPVRGVVIGNSVAVNVIEWIAKRIASYST